MNLKTNPLTDGEIEGLLGRWEQIAEDEEDFKVVSALAELLRIREAATENRVEQFMRDRLAMLAACDEDYEGYGNFIGACG